MTRGSARFGDEGRRQGGRPSIAFGYHRRPPGHATGFLAGARLHVSRHSDSYGVLTPKNNELAARAFETGCRSAGAGCGAGAGCCEMAVRVPVLGAGSARGGDRVLAPVLGAVSWQCACEQLVRFTKLDDTAT